MNIDDATGDALTVKNDDSVNDETRQAAPDLAVVELGEASCSELLPAVNIDGEVERRFGRTFLAPRSYALIPAAAQAPSRVPLVDAIGISEVEGALFSGQVAEITNADLAPPYTDITATIDWGDGSTTAGIVGPDLSVTGSHTYVRFGKYALKVTAQTPGVMGVSSTGQAVISNAPFTAPQLSLTCNAFGVWEAVATFVDANPFGVATDYSAEVLWGDECSSIGKVVTFRDGFKVVVSHGYTKKGKFTVTVTIRDKAGVTATATSSLKARPAK